MAKPIKDLLHRRNDLGTFLVHLTKDGPDGPAFNNLLDILFDRRIEARTAMGVALKFAENDQALADTQKTVCFTETPLEHIWMMCEEIEHREVNMQPYGLVFTKTWARREGANPVFYMDQTPGHDWLTKPVNLMLEAAAAGQAVDKDLAGNWVTVPLSDAPVAKIAPFIEPMGKFNVLREWWWEREWRHVGDLAFSWDDIVVVLVPEGEQQTFHTAFEARRVDEDIEAPDRALRYLDPRWGQERMIAALADIPAANIGPFPNG